MSEERLLKILCLHGYRQNATIFRQKLGGFRRACRKQAEFVFINAPHFVASGASSDENVGDDSDESERGWWLPGEDVASFDAQLSVSFQTISDAQTSLGPFDGILGFSQGASVIGYYLVDPAHKSPFQFAIFAAKSPTRPHLKFLFDSHKITVPTLHVFGESDDICPMKDSVDFLGACEKARTVIHPGGHFFPAAAAQKKTYVSFLEEMSKWREATWSDGRRPAEERTSEQEGIDR